MKIESHVDELILIFFNFNEINIKFKRFRRNLI